MSKFRIPPLLQIPVAVLAVVIFSFLVGLVAHWLGAYSPIAWGFFALIGIFLAVILFIGFRQLYWLFTGKGDYEGGGLPGLWRKIFKK